jgi:hypothetical protein
MDSVSEFYGQSLYISNALLTTSCTSQALKLTDFRLKPNVRNNLILGAIRQS